MDEHEQELRHRHGGHPYGGSHDLRPPSFQPIQIIKTGPPRRLIPWWVKVLIVLSLPWSIPWILRFFRRMGELLSWDFRQIHDFLMGPAPYPEDGKAHLLYYLGWGVIIGVPLAIGIVALRRIVRGIRGY